MSELLDWAEKAGLENLRFRLQNAETLAKEAATTLTVLMAGIGGAMAYAVKGFEQTHTVFTVAVGVFGCFLMIVAALLVRFCILTTELELPTNEPLNLYQKDYTFEALKEAELRNLGERIKKTTARNHRVAAWLDRVRLLAISSPMVFALAAAITSWVWAAR